MILISAVTALFFLFKAGHKHNCTVQHWSKQEQADKAGSDGMRLCSTELRLVFFWELVKNEKSQAQNWTEVSVWQKQIDRRSRWIQYWLIRWILRDSWALPNTAHPLQLNPYKIPTPNTKLHILKGTESHTKVHHWNTSCNTNIEN